MKRFSWLLPSLILIFLLGGVARSRADEAVAPVEYLKEIKPLLKTRCYACHGGLKQEAGLRLDTGKLIRKGSRNGQVLQPGLADGALIQRIRSIDPSHRMPPEGEPLSAVQIARIPAWLLQGAISPDDEFPERDPRLHWAFQPPVRPTVPEVANSGWVRNPVDAFIAQGHERHKLIPQPPATKQEWLRRVTLDLIGLPPARQELHAFLSDESPDATARIVDRLLNSAQYGERWGRHWMDVWRYADWYGRRYVPDVWNSAPQIWRWRDWIVKSLNHDKSYGQMVAEMLAADEISPADDEAGHATGYLIRNWYALNPNDWMRSNVEHVGKAFLGLTFNCAHCHDHKYDPISQDDYFRFRAFFEPISIRQERVPGEADPGPFQEYQYSTLRKIVRLGAVSIFDKTPDAPTWFYTGGDERNRVVNRGSIAPGLPSAIVSESLKIEPVPLPAVAWYPGLRPSIHETILAEHRTALASVESQLPSVIAVVEAALPELQSKLDLAEAEFEQARKLAEEAGRSGALAGRQSLVVDSTSGRRLVQHRLQHVKSLGEQATIRFQLQILKDAHVNFQLAKDHLKGLTAGYVGFKNGRIISYQPASFTEFEVGQYDMTAGQNRFEVVLVLQAKDDICQLTIRSVPDKKTLVENVPVARNGWNPVGDETKAVTFDVQTGAVAAFDELELFVAESDAVAAKVAAPRVAYFDFEPPNYRDGYDIIGVDGWIGSSFSQAGATSVISGTFGDETLKPLSKKMNMARRAIDVHVLKRKSLEAKRTASLAQIESTNARIIADRVKYGQLSGPDLNTLTHAASQKYREAVCLLADADVIEKDQTLAVAELKPLDDPNRAKEVEAASQQLSKAKTALEAARTLLADPNQASKFPAFSPTYPQTSTGRRRALAEWIASRNNPLTARVAVNHIWMRHFHSPLVATVSDFGRNGAVPSHPELLDWLAVELMESGWSMKHIHRLIVSSNTYGMSSSSGRPIDTSNDVSGIDVVRRTEKQASSASSENLSQNIDPENRILWRMNRGRMEAEVVRDSLLSGAGRLDLQMGGQELENSQALTTRRRTLYYSCQPEIDGKSSFGTLFDAPEPADCYRRTRSIIPQQALALTNSDLIHELSGELSAGLYQTLSPEHQADPSAFIVAAHEQILGRGPTDSEMTLCIEFL
ncbi:MAG: PSD1 and planctomycete cytochrome C domain-containing protein, partial [Schlesneria sp.]